MELYILIMLFMIFLGIFELSKDSYIQQQGKKRKILCGVCFLLLFIVSILRDESVGADLVAYKYSFNYIVNQPFPTIDYLGWEKGYVLLNSTIGLITDNFRVLIIVVATIILGGYSIFIYKNSYNISFSFFLLITLGFFAHSLNIYRQSIALIFILIAFEKINKKQLIKYIFWITMATLFHKTAIVALPFYFICKLKFNFNYIIIAIVSMPIIILIGNTVINIVISTTYSTYGELVIRGEGYYLLIIYICMFIFLLLYRKQIEKRYLELNKNFKLKIDPNILYHSIFICLILQFLSLSFSLFNRVTLYYSIFFIILIPNVVESINKKDRIIIKLLIYILMGLFFLLITIQDASSIVPYKIN